MGIESKLELLYSSIEEDGGIFDLAWCTDLLYPYFEHFADTNSTIRAGSLIAFWGLLNEWEDQSGFPFYREGESFQYHHFDKYMEEFLAYSSGILLNFPNIYAVIIESLFFLDNRDSFEATFPNIHSSFFRNIRNTLFKNVVKLPNQIYQEALREAGIILHRKE